MLTGEVVYVSADTVEGKQPGQHYNVSRIAIPDDRLSRIDDIGISPGMPVEMYIKTGGRTLVGYIVLPVTECYSRAMREREPEMWYVSQVC